MSSFLPRGNVAVVTKYEGDEGNNELKRRYKIESDENIIEKLLVTCRA